MSSKRSDSAAAKEVTAERELFVDEYIIAESRNVKRRLHPFRKYPGNPILVADRPWEGAAAFIYGYTSDPEGLEKLRGAYPNVKVLLLGEHT